MANKEKLISNNIKHKANYSFEQNTKVAAAAAATAPQLAQPVILVQLGGLSVPCAAASTVCGAPPCGLVELT